MRLAAQKCRLGGHGFYSARQSCENDFYGDGPLDPGPSLAEKFSKENCTREGYFCGIDGL
jgi:hypothetical protein